MEIRARKLAVRFLALTAALAPVTSWAALVTCGTGKTFSGNYGFCTWSDLLAMADTVIKFLIFDFGVPVAVIVVIVSGIMLVWNPSNSTADKVLWKGRLGQALWGLVIALAAYLIVKLVVVALTGGSDFYKLQNLFK